MLWRPSTIGFLCTSSSDFGSVIRSKATKIMSDTAASTATTSNSNRLLIVDTDVGFDDLVALQCLLNAHATARQNGSYPPSLRVTTVGGVVEANRGSTILKGLFPYLDILTGMNSPCMPFDPLPDWLHSYRTEELDAFARDMNVDLDNLARKSSPSREDSSVTTNLNTVKRILENPGDRSVDILAIGPLTNLSAWIDQCEKD